MASRRINLQFPIGGVDRRYGYQNQPPFTTPDSLNCRPDRIIRDRPTGGSRPGIDLAMQVPSTVQANPISFMREILYVDESGQDIWMDDFSGGLVSTDDWTTATWLNKRPGIRDGNYVQTDSQDYVGVVRTAFDSWLATTAQEIIIELFIVPHLGLYDADYEIYACLDATTPDVTADGFMFRLTITGNGATTGKMELSAASSVTVTETFTATTPASATGAGIFLVHISNTTCGAWWRGTQVLSWTDPGDQIPIETLPLVGFGMKPSKANVTALIGSFRVQWARAGYNRRNRRRLVVGASVSNEVAIVRERLWTGFPTVLGSGPSLAPDRRIETAVYLQKLYIADAADPKVANTDGVVELGAIDSVLAGDFTTYGIETDGDVVVLSDVGGDVTAGTYKITGVTASSITTTPLPGTTGTCTYSVERGPKVYNAEDDTYKHWESTSGKGTIPGGCHLVTQWHQRIVMAGRPRHIFYMSRIGDPDDWDFFQDELDTSRAVGGTLASYDGQIGDEITALIPHSDDYLIFGCRDSIWILRGDLTLGTKPDNLSNSIGVLGNGAWTHGPSGELIFLSRAGLFLIDAGANVYPQSLSREKLPADLLNINTDIYDPVLAWDNTDKGVYIFLAGPSAQFAKHWWFDWQTKSFWPIQTQRQLVPFCAMTNWTWGGEGGSLLFGCRDGVLRRPHRDFDSDDKLYDVIQGSHVLYGPLRLGQGDDREGVLSELEVILGDESTAVDWGLYPGESAQQAFRATALASGTFSDVGLNIRERPLVRGASCFLRLENTSGVTGYRRWGIERATAVIRAAGKLRK